MEALRFHPILKRALWGGQRLSVEFGKSSEPIEQLAESWEVADLPDDVSIVADGQLAGKSLRDLMQSHRQSLLGKHADLDRFPLLVKFLDAHRDLSVQVHPGVEMAQRYPDVTTGKAEFWVVVDAKPGSQISVGLKPGVDREALIDAINSGTVPQLLNTYEVKTGDCIFLEPGTVHSLGAGLLIAEIQQPNNVTYRLDDWGRLGPDGKPRELHTDLALEAIKFSLGPIHPLSPSPVENQPFTMRLVDNSYFTVLQHSGPAALSLSDDNRAHVLTLIRGNASVGPQERPMNLGETFVLPAEREELEIQLSENAVLLDSFLR